MTTHGSLVDLLVYPGGLSANPDDVFYKTLPNPWVKQGYLSWNLGDLLVNPVDPWMNPDTYG